MFKDRSVFDFVQLIQLSLELHEVPACVGIGVDHAFLELFEGVDYHQEIGLLQEEIVVAGRALINDVLGSDNHFVLISKDLDHLIIAEDSLVSGHFFVIIVDNLNCLSDF